MADTEARWYVAHTYSGYENKVKADIENTIVNRNLQDQILEVYVPMQEVEREGKDSKKLVQQKMFPAYVLIKMFMVCCQKYSRCYRIRWSGIKAGSTYG